MKGLFKPLSFFATLVLLFAFSLNVNAQVEVFDDNEPIFTVVENEAEFTGGSDSLNKFINDNLLYPEEAFEKKIKGTVFLTFVIEKDGSINDIKILRDIGYGCAEEAIRVVKLMPKWKSAKQREINVRQQYHLPIRFKLPKE